AQLRKKLKRQKGECTWCGKAVPAGGRTWCSRDCVDAFRAEHDWSWIRSQVETRDRGICALCGVDCLKIRRLVRIVRFSEEYTSWRHLDHHYRQQGWGETIARNMWEVDHIVPRVRSGGNELANLRTLCVPCHKASTARLAADRARERRDHVEPSRR
ncbi:hypothetical protein LCGC14_2218520, partial [marine sediment metagenome]